MLNVSKSHKTGPAISLIWLLYLGTELCVIATLCGFILQSTRGKSFWPPGKKFQDKNQRSAERDVVGATTRENPQAANFSSIGKWGLKPRRDRFQPRVSWPLTSNYSFELQLEFMSIYLWLWKHSIHLGAISLGHGAKRLERKVARYYSNISGREVGKENNMFPHLETFCLPWNCFLLFLYVGVLQISRGKKAYFLVSHKLTLWKERDKKGLLLVWH